MLPTIAEYDKLYNLCNDDDDDTNEDIHEDYTNENIHENGIAPNDDIEWENEWRGYDDEFNITFEVPIMKNIVVLFASSEFRMDSVPISPTVHVTVNYS